MPFITSNGHIWLNIFVAGLGGALLYVAIYADIPILPSALLAGLGTSCFAFFVWNLLYPDTVFTRDEIPGTPSTP